MIQINAVFLLMNEGVKLGKLSEDYKILAHKQIADTESPGMAFYEVIKTWERWSSEV